ncbi:MAG TPA: alpha-glucan family phosphorylase [Mycobacteriales bacterium]|nr:alpha-glucan family phosphorylase [Mycobacteriales bacterium]
MKALRRFTVRARLPEALLPLGDLVMNLRWSWHAPTQDLFAAVDAELWEHVRHDPVRLLGEVPAERMDALAADTGFLARLADEHRDLQDYLTRPRWYQGLDDAPASIAYFSPEYGITEVLPQYSGGLGILAGDHLKTASDLGVPIIGVGLLYRRGYFRQSLSTDGWQLEHYPPLDPHGLPLTLLTGDDGAPLRVEIGLPGGTGTALRAQVWKAQVGRVPLLLLDSDIEDNAPAEREVTDRLYGGGTDHRLLQEMLLGIGGVRALTAYGVTPEVFHTNEGHAGFLGLERIRVLTDEQGLDFDTALEVVRAGTVFTTHTPVPAGIDRFPKELIERFFGGDNAAPGVPLERILELGDEPGGDGTVFNMAFMGLRLAQRANGVSRLHGEVSREMFAGLWPGFDAAEVPISHVTNGVHAPTWVARPVMDLALARDVNDAARSWDSIEDVPDATIWDLKRGLRAGLVDEVRRRVRESWLARGANSAELRWTGSVFDPDVLTIGFARRVPSYKRLTLILRDRERLQRLLLDPERPMQLVIAGKAHPADDGGKLLVQEIVRFADDAAVRHRIAFLPDYDIGMARHLYAGCDVWLNNPLRPLEACGTSGMKAALNGGLNLSILDGWWDELYDGSNGWAIPSAGTLVDAARRDDLEAAAIYELLESAVLPQFYQRDADGVPTRWTSMVRHTLRSLGPAVLSTRMLRDYVAQLYAPAAQSSRAMQDDGYRSGRELAEWRRTIVKAWPSVVVRHVESWGVGDSPELGTALTVRAVVDLGTLRPEDVDVHAAYGRVDEADEISAARVVPLAVAGDHGDGEWRYEGELPLRHTGPVGYTVRVLPRHPALASSADLGLVTSA